MVDLAHAAQGRVELRRLDDPGVRPVEAHGDGAMRVDGAHQLLVDLAHQGHLGHLHGGFVSHALPVLPAHGDAHAAHHLGDGGAAAVHDHGIGAHQLEHDEVVDHRLAQVCLHHGRAAVLDDDRLARDVLDPRHHLHQGLSARRMGQLAQLLDVYFLVLPAKNHVFPLASVVLVLCCGAP